jgi:Uma2 family endonuclease
MVTATLEIPAPLPRSIVFDPPLSDAQFEWLSMNCDFASLERTREGAIIVNAPVSSSGSSGNNEIARQLGNWWIEHERGSVFDSSGGFFLPDGSMLVPDAAYATPSQLVGLTSEDHEHLLHLAPAFVIELLSPSDRLPALKKKMETWMANGVQLSWLIDPYAKQVHVYDRGRLAQIKTGPSIAGSGAVDGFVLDLEKVWRRYKK